MRVPKSLAKIQDREERIRKLIAMEISRIVEDLEERVDLLAELWSKHRDRTPLLETVHSRWRTLGFPELAELPTDEVVLVDAFYRELSQLTMYFRFTEDMPSTLSDEVISMTARLRVIADLALEALGGAPERPKIEFKDEPEPEVEIVDDDEETLA